MRGWMGGGWGVLWSLGRHPPPHQPMPLSIPSRLSIRAVALLTPISSTYFINTADVSPVPYPSLTPPLPL